MSYKQDTNLEFLKNKINEIKIALFKPESDFELQLPNNIVQTLRVDDDGTIWFFTTCNGNYARFMNKSFYAWLNYYKKDTGCHLQLSGKTTIILEEDNCFAMDSDYSGGAYTTVLIKMKIMQAEYFENKIDTEVSWTEKIKSAVAGLFFSTAHRIYDFS